MNPLFSGFASIQHVMLTNIANSTTVSSETNIVN